VGDRRHARPEHPQLAVGLLERHAEIEPLALQQFGDVRGIESDTGSVERSGRWRERIVVGTLDDHYAPPAPFDLILMLDVLEHVEDPEGILRLATEGGCNAVASTLGVMGLVARKYAHRIPFILKLNHNELLTYPNKFDQIMFARVRQAVDMGAVAVGATIYFGSPESREQIRYVSQMFEEAHSLGMVTVLWCYTRNNAFKVKGPDGKSIDYHAAADLTGSGEQFSPAASRAICCRNRLILFCLSGFIGMFGSNASGFAAATSIASSRRRWPKRPACRSAW